MLARDENSSSVLQVKLLDKLLFVVNEGFTFRDTHNSESCRVHLTVVNHESVVSMEVNRASATILTTIFVEVFVTLSTMSEYLRRRQVELLTKDDHAAGASRVGPDP